MTALGRVLLALATSTAAVLMLAALYACAEAGDGDYGSVFTPEPDAGDVRAEADVEVPSDAAPAPRDAWVAGDDALSRPHCDLWCQLSGGGTYGASVGPHSDLR